MKIFKSTEAEMALAAVKMLHKHNCVVKILTECDHGPTQACQLVNNNTRYVSATVIVCPKYANQKRTCSNNTNYYPF